MFGSRSKDGDYMDLFMLGLLQKMSRGGGKSVSHSSSYTINNTVDYPIVGLNLYGKSTQNGTPTPETPVDIVSVGNNGFDIISKNDTHFNLLSVRDNGGDIITKQPCSMAAKLGDTIKITIVASGESLTYQWQFLTPTATEWRKSNSAGNNTNTLMPTIDNGWNNVKVRCIVTDSNGNSEISNELTVYVVSDDCEVKMESIVTDALPLCGIPVESGGNYTDSNGQQWICDELMYNADGTGKIKKYTNDIIFNGSENWKISTNGKRSYVNIADSIKGKYKSDTAKAYLFSNKYIAGSVIDTWFGYKTCLSIANNSDFTVYDERFVGDVTGLKADMAANNLRVVYALNTPSEIELTSEEMAALRQLQTFDGVTNISTSDNADIDVKYCTDKSLSECVLPITMGLQKQIDELQVYVQKQIDEIEAGILTPGILIIPGSYAETIIGPIITEGDE